MDILAAQLHSKIKEATIDECKKALQKMSMPQAIEYLRKKYSNERKENIKYLKENFPEKSNDLIIKVLDESNNDLYKALEILYNNPESLEQNKDAGIIPNGSHKVHMKKRSSSNKLTNLNFKKIEKTNDNSKASLLLSSVSHKNRMKVNSKLPSTTEKSKSSIISHDPIVIQKVPKSIILPRMEIPPNKIESEWNKSPNNQMRNFNQNYTFQKKAPQAKDINNPIFVNDQSYSDYSDEYYEEEDEEEEEYINESQPSGESLKTERIDLHGLVKQEARFIVESSIIHAKQNGIGVFHFMTGKGNHSVNNEPILRPLVLEICKKYNVYAYIPEINTGYVVCNVCKPFVQQ